MSADYFIVNMNKKAKLDFSCNCRAGNLEGIKHYMSGDEVKASPVNVEEFKKSYLAEFTDEVESVEEDLKAILAFCSNHDVIIMNDNQAFPDEIYAFTKFTLKVDGSIHWESWNDDALW